MKKLSKRVSSLISIAVPVKGKRNNPDSMEGASAASSISESGWSNRLIFQSYLENHFMKHVHVQPPGDKPMLLMYDRHASHTKMYVSLFDPAGQGTSHHTV